MIIFFFLLKNERLSSDEDCVWNAKLNVKLSKTLVGDSANAIGLHGEYDMDWVRNTNLSLEMKC